MKKIDSSVSLIRSNTLCSVRDLLLSSSKQKSTGLNNDTKRMEVSTMLLQWLQKNKHNTPNDNNKSNSNTAITDKIVCNYRGVLIDSIEEEEEEEDRGTAAE